MQVVTLDVALCCCSCANSDTVFLWFFVCVFFVFFFLLQVRTGDLGGYATSDEFTQAVIAHLAVWALCLQISQLLRHIHAHTHTHRPCAKLAVQIDFSNSLHYVSYFNVQNAVPILLINLFNSLYLYYLLIYDVNKVLVYSGVTALVLIGTQSPHL